MWFPYIQPLSFQECCNRRKLKPYMKQLLLALTDLHSPGLSTVISNQIYSNVSDDRKIDADWLWMLACSAGCQYLSLRIMTDMPNCMKFIPDLLAPGATGKANQRTNLLHKLSMLAYNIHLPGNGKEQASHLCDTRECFHRWHLFTESIVTNNSRKGCPVTWTWCVQMVAMAWYTNAHMFQNVSVSSVNTRQYNLFSLPISAENRPWKFQCVYHMSTMHTF